MFDFCLFVILVVVVVCVCVCFLTFFFQNYEKCFQLKQVFFSFFFSFSFLSSTRVPDVMPYHVGQSCSFLLFPLSSKTKIICFIDQYTYMCTLFLQYYKHKKRIFSCLPCLCTFVGENMQQLALQHLILKKYSGLELELVTTKLEQDRFWHRVLMESAAVGQSSMF